eukprot:5101753-Pleurochrysis_carterae.AAC.2
MTCATHSKQPNLLKLQHIQRHSCEEGALTAQKNRRRPAVASAKMSVTFGKKQRHGARSSHREPRLKGSQRTASNSLLAI